MNGIVICDALGKKARIWRIPRGLMDAVAKVGVEMMPVEARGVEGDGEVS